MLVLQLFQGLYTLFTSDPKIALARIGLILLGAILIYGGYKKVLEPLIMIPMGLGMIAINSSVLILEAGRYGDIFIAPLVSDPTELMNVLQINFLQPLYTFTFSNGLIACLVFMGIGALTDIDFLIAKPMLSMMLAVAAEFGTIFTFPIALAMGLNPGQAASTALIGGADGPMVLFSSLILAKDLFVPIAVVGYLYLSLTYGMYPFLIKWLIPKRLRGIEMDWRTIPKVPRGEKLAFVVVATTILCLLFPVAGPLYFSFMLGVAIKESDLPHHLSFLSETVLYGSTFFLGAILGTLMSAETILNPKVLILFILGLISILLSGLGGLAGGLIAYKISKGKINPLLGIAAVSCVPTCAKIAQKCAYDANKKCMIVPFAMGPNVAGVITTSIICGIYITAIQLPQVASFFGS
ncbi:MAG: sodium ion-translocating decarboxylase subunit beta [Dehalococcoidales bacterium]|nr:sodium ion-translocating decarboxylase subunit beta [Dehalococcoidales bacterium]